MYLINSEPYTITQSDRGLVLRKIAHGTVRNDDKGRTWYFNGPTKRWRLQKLKDGAKSKKNQVAGLDVLEPVEGDIRTYHGIPHQFRSGAWESLQEGDSVQIGDTVHRYEDGVFATESEHDRRKGRIAKQKARTEKRSAKAESARLRRKSEAVEPLSELTPQPESAIPSTEAENLKRYEQAKQRFADRPTYQDGRLIPQVGDSVYFSQGNWMGGASTYRGVVEKTKAGKLQVKLTDSPGGVVTSRGKVVSKGSTLPLDEAWNVEGDPKRIMRDIETDRRIYQEQQREKQRQDAKLSAYDQAIKDGLEPAAADNIAVGDRVRMFGNGGLTFDYEITSIDGDRPYGREIQNGVPLGGETNIGKLVGAVKLPAPALTSPTPSVADGPLTTPKKVLGKRYAEADRKMFNQETGELKRIPGGYNDIRAMSLRLTDEQFRAASDILNDYLETPFEESDLAEFSAIARQSMKGSANVDSQAAAEFNVIFTEYEKDAMPFTELHNAAPYKDARGNVNTGGPGVQRSAEGGIAERRSIPVSAQEKIEAEAAQFFNIVNEALALKGAKDGDRYTVNGRVYELKNQRWSRVGESNTPPVTPAPTLQSRSQALSNVMTAFPQYDFRVTSDDRMVEVFRDGKYITISGTAPHNLEDLQQRLEEIPEPVLKPKKPAPRKMKKSVIYSLDNVNYIPAAFDTLVLVKAAKQTLNDGDKKQDAQGRTWVFNGQTRRWKIHREEGATPKGKGKSKAKEVMPTIAESGATPTQSAAPAKSKTRAKKPKESTPKVSRGKSYTSASGNRFQRFQIEHNGRTETIDIKTRDGRNGPELMSYAEAKAQALKQFQSSGKPAQDSGSGEKASEGGDRTSTPTTTKSRSKKPKAEAATGGDRPPTQKKSTTPKSIQSEQPLADGFTVEPIGGEKRSGYAVKHKGQTVATGKTPKAARAAADKFYAELDETNKAKAESGAGASSNVRSSDKSESSKTAETPSTLKPKSQSTATVQPKETRAQSLQRQIDHLKAVKAPMSEARQKTIETLEEQLKAEGGGQRSKTKNKKSVSTIPPATKKKSEKQEFNTQSPEISAKDLLSEPNMFEARTVNLPPDIKDALERGDYGSAANKYILEAEGMRFSKSEAADATRYAKDIAARINQVRNPSQLRGANLYGAEKFRNGPKITSQQKFDRLYDEVTRTMSDAGAGELLPIYKIRRAMGDRVSRAEFDEFLYKTTQRRSHRLVESGVEDNAKDKFLDSVVTNLGHLRTYISTQT